MHMYTERTQVLLSPAQRDRIERLAFEQRKSVGAVIRDAIDAHTRALGTNRLAARDSLFALEAPAPDWSRMKEEIERGELT